MISIIVATIPFHIVRRVGAGFSSLRHISNIPAKDIIDVTDNLAVSGVTEENAEGIVGTVAVWRENYIFRLDYFKICGTDRGYAYPDKYKPKQDTQQKLSLNFIGVHY